MSEEILLQEMVQVRGRFHRSVVLSQDYHDPSQREGYIETRLSQRLTNRMVNDLNMPEGRRAWSLVGPYGTGKSSFVLQLLDVLSDRPSAKSDRQLSIIRHRLLPVVMVGERAPLLPALLLALSRALAPFSVEKADELRALAAHEELHSQQVVDAFHRVLDQLPSLAPAYVGLAVALDELGKNIEFAVLNPEKEDLYVLQGLAELASRSPRQFFLITVMHMSLADYFRDRDLPMASEWLKVNGRFQPVSFVQGPEELLQLTAEALQVRLSPSLQEVGQQLVQRTLATEGLRETLVQIKGLSELLPRLLPLHPLAALILPPLFRSKLAQNERSLFSFLTSLEEHGFQKFLNATKVAPGIRQEELPLYDLEMLFDYIVGALGAAALRGENARHWAEVTNSLDRLPSNAPWMARGLIKVIGLLTMYGAPVGLKAHRSILALALQNETGFEEACSYLEKHSFILFRRHLDAYGLWEGSDVDLEAAYSRAHKQLSHENLAMRLERLVQLQPRIARAHYFETGTLRAFRPVLVAPSDEALKYAYEAEDDTMEGRLLFVIPTTEAERQRVLTTSIHLTNEASKGHGIRLVAIARPLAGLAMALQDLEAWQQVGQSTPELRGDPVARREVQSRIYAAQHSLEKIAGETLGLRGHLFRPELCQWVYEGSEYHFSSATTFMTKLSDFCGKVFAKEPVLRNELINRSVLSSPATAARNSLLKAMLEAPERYRLGFVGTPPEVSIYESVLAMSGMHRKEGESYGFYPPPVSEKAGSWYPVWQAMELFLESTVNGQRPVSELYALLKAPPYGIKEGPLPILLMALLRAYGPQIALYKEGLFIPELMQSTLDLLARNPQQFTLQRFVLGPTEQQLLRAIRMALQARGMVNPSQSIEVASVAQALITPIAQLNAFTRQTRRLSSQAIALRELAMKAREPLRLLVEELPEVLLSSDERVQSPEVQAQKLTHALILALNELHGAYPTLLNEIEQHLRGAFELTGSREEARQQLRMRFQHLISFKSDHHLIVFIREAARESEGDWRESLARVINKGLPPASWQDHELPQFAHRLDLLLSDLKRLEALRAEKQAEKTTMVPQMSTPWAKAVAFKSPPIPPEQEKEVQSYKRELQRLWFREGSLNDRGVQELRRLALLLLAEELSTALPDNQGT